MKVSARKIKFRQAFLLIAGMQIVFVPYSACAGIVEASDLLWYKGSATGEIAGKCMLIENDSFPLTIPTAIVVDNNVPDGTVIYSWDYGQFIDLNINCRGDGDSATGGYYLNVIIPSQRFMLTFPDEIGVRINGVSSGFKIKMYAKYDWEGQEICQGGICQNNPYSGYFTTVNSEIISKGTEYNGSHLRSLSAFNRPNMQIFPSQNASTGKYHIWNGSISVSTRAELIKNGPVSYGNITSTIGSGAHNNAITFEGTNTSIFQRLNVSTLSGNAITLVAPSCRLKNNIYNISMGRWSADMINYNNGGSVTSSGVPVELTLECSGNVSNVTAKFNDTGSNPSSAQEKNITLYNDAGNKVEGLEIEMRYNNNRINIDGTTLNIGSHGASANYPSSSQLEYNSESIVNFSAHYRQTGQITSGGNSFTGNVRGAVNVTIEYN